MEYIALSAPLIHPHTGLQFMLLAYLFYYIEQQ